MDAKVAKRFRYLHFDFFIRHAMLEILSVGDCSTGVDYNYNDMVTFFLRGNGMVTKLHKWCSHAGPLFDFFHLS
jgi:hypothetical protein